MGHMDKNTERVGEKETVFHRLQVQRKHKDCKVIKVKRQRSMRHFHVTLSPSSPGAPGGPEGPDSPY